jgi:hypothetical protein
VGILDATAGNGAGVKGPKARPCPQIGLRVRGGALWRKGVGPRGLAREHEREREHDVAARSWAVRRGMPR